MGSGMAKIPPVNGTCPMLTGLSGATVTVNGQTVLVWSGNPGGAGAPLVFYWHGLTSSAKEANGILDTETKEVVSGGGLVASFDSTTGMGTNTSGSIPATFYSGDFNTADQILACAVKQLNIDTSRIISGGCGAGGLQTGSMLYYRSSYLACAMPNSGGVVAPGTFQDSHVPSLITTHGAAGMDVIVYDFAMTSLTEDRAVKMAASGSMPPGGYVVDCNHGKGVCGATASNIAAQWQFCKDHPFGVSPDPYNGALPSSFPTYCTYQ
jgi:predicted esterase